MRVNRIRRKKEGGLTPDQSWWFGLGMNLSRGPLFESEQDEYEAWVRHRDQLMSERSSPGHRPYGYFKHELKLPNPLLNSTAEIDELDERGLLDEHESAEIEKTNRQLDPNQDPSAWSCYDHPEVNTYLVLGQFIVDDFEVAARWHRRRGRTALADVWQRRANVCKEYLKGRGGKA